MKLPQKKHGTFVATLCIALALNPLAQAANLTWDTTSAADATITNGNATWTAGAGNWNNGSTSVGVTFATGDTVTFGSGGNLATNHTVTLGGATTTVGSINANYTGNLSYTIGATANTQAIAFTGGNGSINVTGAPLNGINFNAVVVGNFTVTGSGNRGVVLWGNGNQTTANTITVSPSTLLQAGANSSTGSFGSAAIVNNGVVTYRRSGTLNMTNAISGNGSVNYQLRASTTTLNTAGTYLGNTSFSSTGANAGSSTVNWNVANVLPSTTALSLSLNSNSSITLDLKGFNQTVASLAGTGTVSDSIVTSSIGTPTLTISGTTNTSFGGLLSGSLALTKNNTGNLTLNGVSTYTGGTTISGGSLVLGAAGSINATSLISIAAGGTLNVSAIPAYTLSASTGLSASGAASPADIKGGTTVNLGSRPITLLHDGTNPALTVSQGALTLNGNAFTIHSTNPLPAGSHTLIQQASGTITNSGSFTVAGTAISGSTASLDFGTAGAVNLNLVAAPVSDTNSTLAASTATLAADNVATSTLTITLRDAANAPLNGVGVKWAVSGSSNTIAPSDFGTTDGSGVVTFTVKSRKAETKTVTVTVGAFTFTTDLVFTAPATGFTFTWDPLLTKTASDGAGPWNLTTASWAEGGANSIWLNNGNDAAIFGTGGALAANTSVTLGAPITLGNLTFTNTSATTNQYTIAGAGLNILTLAGTPTINVAANAMITAPLAGAGFIKEGAGTLRIDGNNPSYSGAVTVNNGVLQLGNNGAGGSLGNNTITLAGSAIFLIRKGTGGSMSLDNTLAGATSANVGFQLNNNAVITVSKANTYTASGGTYLQPTGANTVGTLALGIADGLPTTTAFSINANGATSLQTFDLAGFNQTVASLGGTGTATSAIITSSSGTPTLTVSGNATTTFAGLVSGSLSLTKAGSGSQTFSGNVTYSGNTTVTEGILSLPKDNANNDASTVTIASTGATLDLNFAGSDTVGTLFIGGAQQAAGVYEAIGNAGSGTEIAQITGAGTLTVLSSVVADTTPPAAPTVSLLANSDSGSSGSDLITNLTTPTLRVTLNGTDPTAPLAGDVVKLFNDVIEVASATLSAGDIAATFVDLTTGALAPGSLSFTATVTDAANNVSNASTALPVTLDTTAPVITVTSPSSNSAAWGASYTDAGATASDDIAPFTATVNTTNPVSTATPGVYTVTYNATDVAGNTATPATRAVTVAIANATTVGADGFSPLMKYALGATSPTDTVQAPALSSTASTLALTAVVRTNDPAVVVTGEAVDSLNGTWGTGGTVTMTVAGDQTNLPANCQRRVFTVALSGTAPKFLRLRVVSTP